MKIILFRWDSNCPLRLNCAKFWFTVMVTVRVRIYGYELQSKLSTEWMNAVCQHNSTSADLMAKNQVQLWRPVIHWAPDRDLSVTSEHDLCRTQLVETAAQSGTAQTHHSSVKVTHNGCTQNWLQYFYLKNSFSALMLLNEWMNECRRFEWRYHRRTVLWSLRNAFNEETVLTLDGRVPGTRHCHWKGSVADRAPAGWRHSKCRRAGRSKTATSINFSGQVKCLGEVRRRLVMEAAMDQNA